ncbi:MAG: hypothetical protein WC761_04340 [Candidatus Paceibacterota bacterium]|jgi:hypothetical protein
MNFEESSEQLIVPQEPNWTELQRLKDVEADATTVHLLPNALAGIVRTWEVGSETGWNQETVSAFHQATREFEEICKGIFKRQASAPTSELNVEGSWEDAELLSLTEDDWKNLEVRVNSVGSSLTLSDQLKEAYSLWQAGESTEWEDEDAQKKFIEAHKKFLGSLKTAEVSALMRQYRNQ